MKNVALINAKSQKDLERDSGENDQQKDDCIQTTAPHLYTSVHRRVWDYSVRVMCPGVGP